MMFRKSSLLIILLVAACAYGPRRAQPSDHDGQDDPSSELLLTDEAYSTACGPISCFCALRSVDVEVSLEEIASRLKWRKGEMTSFLDMYNLLQNTKGVSCQAVRISPEKLEEFLKSESRTAILPVSRSGEAVDHAFCAVTGNAPHILVVDYPEMGRWYHFDELSEIWDGQALLVSRTNQLSTARLWLLAFLPGASLAIAAYMFVRDTSLWKQNTTKGQAPVRVT